MSSIPDNIEPDSSLSESLDPDLQFESGDSETGGENSAGLFDSDGKRIRGKSEPASDDGADGETPSRKDRTLFCFRCHREDRHFHGMRRRWYYNFVLGFSLGLLYIVGPFRCRCCGGWRLMCHDLLSPRFWWQSLQAGPATSSRRGKS